MTDKWVFTAMAAFILAVILIFVSVLVLVENSHRQKFEVCIESGKQWVSGNCIDSGKASGDDT